MASRRKTTVAVSDPPSFSLLSLHCTDTQRWPLKGKKREWELGTKMPGATRASPMPLSHQNGVFLCPLYNGGVRQCGHPSLLPWHVENPPEPPPAPRSCPDASPRHPRQTPGARRLSVSDREVSVSLLTNDTVPGCLGTGIFYSIPGDFISRHGDLRHRRSTRSDTLKSASDKSDHFRGTWPPQTLRESRGHRAVARIHTTFHSHWL